MLRVPVELLAGSVMFCICIGLMEFLKAATCASTPWAHAVSLGVGVHDAWSDVSGSVHGRLLLCCQCQRQASEESGGGGGGE